MLSFSPLSTALQTQTIISAIEKRSNPHPWQQGALIDSYLTCNSLAAFKNQTLVAFTLYRGIVDEAEIIHLVCDKPYQGKGYATALIHHLCQILQKTAVNQLFLEVRKDNQAAQQLYKKLGFITIGCRKNYYKDGCDALLQKRCIAIEK